MIYKENSNILFKKKLLIYYIIQKGSNGILSGVILNISEDGISMEHLCDSSEGSSGGPIINSNNFQVIGVHKGGAFKAKNYNYATFLKQP